MIDFVVDEAVDVAETVIHAAMVDRLKAALPLLSGSEQALINAIFFEELSEREVGLRLGVTQSVVNKRKAKILAKLRKRFCVSVALMKRTLSKIRTDDRADFNSNRRFYRWASDFGEYLEGMADRCTLQIVLLKMQGYSTKEIAASVKLSTKSAYSRMGGSQLYAASGNGAACGKSGGHSRYQL